MRDANDVDMVRHQAVGPDIQAVTECILPQPIEVAHIIRLIIKDGLAVAALLDDMVREAADGGTGQASHLVKYRGVQATADGRGEAPRSDSMLSD